MSANKLRKTTSLFRLYHKVLKEQLDQPQEDGQFDSTAGQEPVSPDVTENPTGETDEQMPMTSAGEDKYIADLIDAALFEPSSEDATLLSNLQSAMKMKKYKNAREEILPTILNIIRPETESSDIRSSLDKL